MTKEIIGQTMNMLISQNDYASVTMEQVAKELGISKKTLYKEFRSKESLIEYTLNSTNEKFVQKVNRYIDNNYCALKICLEMFLWMTDKQIVERQRKNLTELNHRYPTTYENCIKDIKHVIAHCTFQVVQLGKKQGIFERHVLEEDIAELISFYYLNSRMAYIRHATAQELEKNSGSFYYLLFRGFLTPKGLKLLKNSKSIYKSQRITAA